MVIVVNGLSARQGGGQTYLINLLSNLECKNFKIFVFLSTPIDFPEFDNIDFIYVGLFGKNPILRILWEKFYLPLFLRKVSADILFVPGGVSSTPSSNYYKTVTMFRNMIPFDEKVLSQLPNGWQKIRNYLLRQAMLKTMQKSDLTIFISKFASKIIKEKIDLNSSVTIPHGINPEFRKLVALSDGRIKPLKYFLYVSKFDVYKHHDTVINGYAKLPQTVRSEYPLVLIGETDSSEFEKCRSLVKKLGVETNVLFFGPLSYKLLPGYYQHAYINIFASSCENCPNIMLEALAAGRPLLCSDVSPMPEFGEDGVVYFSPYDENSFFESLDSLIGNESLIQFYSGQSLKLSMKFSWEHSSEQTWNAIYSLVDDKKGAEDF